MSEALFWIVWGAGAIVAWPLLTRWILRENRPEDSFEYAGWTFFALLMSMFWPVLLVGALCFVAFAEFGRRVAGTKERVR